MHAKDPYIPAALDHPLGITSPQNQQGVAQTQNTSVTVPRKGKEAWQYQNAAQGRRPVPVAPSGSDDEDAAAGSGICDESDQEGLAGVLT